MDLSCGPEYESFRRMVQEFLSGDWSAGEARNPDRVRTFGRRATKADYLYRSVPRRYGGSEQPPDPLRAQIIVEEFGRTRAPMEVRGSGTSMLIPTLLECGEDWQKQMFIPRTLSGEWDWTQGYSEPGSGSDLASLRTKAELIGNEWVISGHKIWTSQEHHRASEVQRGVRG
jgi:alkylation response protein AidB-like acyl-CoA dehydrogenase